MTVALWVSLRASDRLAVARQWLSSQPADAPVCVVGHSIEAAADLIRGVKRPVFGWKRTTLFRVAADLARTQLGRESRVISSGLANDAVWARVVHRLAERGELDRFTALAARPGLVRALARTCNELRMSGVDSSLLEPALRNALSEYERTLDEYGLADRAHVLRLAAQSAELSDAPLVLLDVTVEHELEGRLISALARSAGSVCAVAPQADAQSVKGLSAALSVTSRVAPAAGEASPKNVAALQDHLFSSGSGDGSEWSDLLSTPGEGREALELARVIQSEAARGVPFDQMAVVLRAPGSYRAAIETAFRRAGIPSWFARGTPQPDPSARALLALLKCAEEHLSARRFSEYVSLGQVPRLDSRGAPPIAAPSSDRYVSPEETTDEKAPEEIEAEENDEPLDGPVVAGTLRAPRRWEALLVEAAVIGENTDRWRRRLTGLRVKNRKKREAPDVSEGHAQSLDRQLGDLDALEAFALPLLDSLAALPARAPWGEWLDQLTALASRALRRPERVLSVLSDLSPMSVVGPVGLREVRGVLTPWLSELTQAPKSRRSGHVFVGPVDAVRGLSFEVVLVPGLVERVFPQKLREDPLLEEDRRKSLGLTVNEDRVAAERLALQLSVGAAQRRVVLTYPRIDSETGRPRVPSFYALEAMRAVEGKLPGFSELQRRAERAGQTRLGWPAPREASRAIDETEYDLAVLDRVLRGEDAAQGQARYLMNSNPFLARALRARYARWTQTRWTAWDGLVSPSEAARQALLPKQLDVAAYSPTALQHFAACPYRFYLSAIVRLQPLEIPEAIEQLGPLERGSLTHEVQFQLLSELRGQGARVRPESLDIVFARLDVVLGQVAEKFHDDFAPAIDRVWKDGIESTRADLREWLRRVAKDLEWEPWRFELSFGLSLSRDQQDPASVADPVKLDQGVRLRGSIDLVEKSVRGTLRATDYKTGRARAQPGSVVGGGKALQPLLYALTLEKIFAEQQVEAGRLFYCTQAGGFTDVPTKLDEKNREILGQVVHTVASSVREGFLPAAPAEGECNYCDFRAVCGPDEERRTKKKSGKELGLLKDIRKLP